MSEYQQPKIQPCFCCGQETGDVFPVVGIQLVAMPHLHIPLCPMCVGTEFKEIDGFFSIDCPLHGHPDIKGMVNYWDAVDKYNQKFGTKLRGTRVKFGINWGKELEKLRKKWLEMLEKE
jgi:hypothetical protein